jgi:AcrR family transcriptional regulator
MNERSFISTVEAGKGVDQAILAGALECFSALGFHGTSMRQIAAAAGTGLGNIYNYFGSKSDILLEVLRRASAEQQDVTDKAIASAGKGVRERFAAAVAAFVRFDVEHQAACFVANSELRYLDHEQRHQIVAERDQQQKVFEDLIEEGLAEGVFRTRHPHDACVAILTMCAGVTLWYRADGPLTADDIADRYSRFALAMLEGE